MDQHFAPFQADLDARNADVQSAQDQIALTKVEFDRNAQAVKDKAVSQSDYDTAKANYEKAEAQLASSFANRLAPGSARSRSG